MFDDLTKNGANQRMIEEALYEQVAKEIENGIKRSGLWAKAIATSEGNESKAKALYIGYRVQSLIDEALLEQEAKKEYEAEVEAEKDERNKKIREAEEKCKQQKTKQYTARESAEIVVECQEVLMNKGYQVKTKGYGWVVIDTKGKSTELSDVLSLKQYTERT